MASFFVDRFVRAPATPGWEVLTIEGRWRSAEPQRLPYAWLVVDDGHRTLRVMPAPAVAHPVGDPAGRAWSATFPLPTDLLAERRLAFALCCGDVVTVDLPHPTPGAPDPTGADAAAAASSDRRRAKLEHDLAEARRERDETTVRVQQAEARARAAERALQAARAALALAEEARLEQAAQRDRDATDPSSRRD